MPRPPIYTPDFLNHAQRLYLSGQSFRQISEAIGGDPETLRKKVRLLIGDFRPHRVAVNAKIINWPELIERYHAGESVLALARAYGCQRKTISDHLLRHGIKPRNRSEGMFTRMARTPEEGRKALAQAANQAVRGSRQTLRHRLNRAQGRGRRIGYGEEDFAKMLRERGFRVEDQAPIDTYNVDLLLNEAVAVELRCESGDPMKDAHQRKRIEHLRDRGFAVVYILFREVDALMGSAEELIADLDLVSRDPAARGQYRVIRCGAERFSRGRNNLGQFTAVPAPVRFRRSIRKGDPD